MASVSFGGENSGLQVGVSNGSIYYNLPANQPESHPEPLMTVPFPHDPDFVSRDELDQLLEKSSIPGSRTALVGLGGVGKSRLAIEYCYQVRQRSPETWVLWVHASNAARCEESLRNLADRAKVPGRQDRNANIFQLFANWLQDGKIGKWVLILDNVDDDELLQKPSATRGEAQNAQNYAPMRPPLRYLLETSTGSIVITSRNKAVASEIAGHEKYLIDVQPMDLTKGLLLMKKKLDSETAQSEELRQLVEELEFMPLAIVQAASYITRRSLRCSVSQYLEKLRRSESQATKLLNQEGHGTDRDWEAKNSISLTWQISFDHIRETRQSAADLLSLMSFFDWQGIPENVIRVQYQDTDQDDDEDSLQDFDDTSSDEISGDSDADDDFQDDIQMLIDYSLIAIGTDSVAYTMHRLVQLTVRTWLKRYDAQEKWKECFISNMNSEFPNGDIENWEICQSLFPHVKSAMSHRPKSQDSLRNWAALLYKGSWYAQLCGNLSDSKDMAATSRDGRMKIGGAEDEDTLNSTMMLAEAYFEAKEWEEAEKLFLQVMEIRKMTLGVDNPATLKSIASLAATYSTQGRLDEAEQLELQALVMSKAMLGVDHADTLTCMSNLALTLGRQGRWNESEQLELHAIEMRKTKIGVDHPDTLSSMGNLACTFRDQGRYDEAEQLELQVLEMSKIKLGVDHPSTLACMNNLALTLRRQGRWNESEQLELYVMEMSKTKIGVDHPFTLSSMGNLACTFRDQGRYDEAEQLELQVLEMSKIKLGVDHPSTLVCMDNLAATLWEQDQLDEVERLEVESTELRKAKLGVDHPDTLSSMDNLASTFRHQGRYDEAEQLNAHVLEIRKMKLGVDHPSTLSSMDILAIDLRFQDRWDEAQQLQVQVMEIRKVKVGVDDPDTLKSMSRLAKTWNDMGRFADAIDLLRDCVNREERVRGPTHPKTLAHSETLLEWETRFKLSGVAI
ncbi:unnamed protein product [Penicillium bialowiezense]